MAAAAAALVAAIGAAVIGGVQLASASSKKKKARGLQPEAEQPEARLELARMKRQAKAYETGKAFQSESEQIQNVQRQMNINTARLSGGATGAAIGGSARNALSTNAALLKLAGQSRTIGLQQRQQQTAQLNRMLQRKDDLDLLAQSQLYAQAAKLDEAGWGNMSQAVKYGASYAGGGVAPDGGNNTSGVDLNEIIKKIAGGEDDGTGGTDG